MGNKQWIGSGLAIAVLWVGACSLTTDLSEWDENHGAGGSGYLAAGGAGGEAAGPATCSSVTDCPPAPGPCESPVCLGNLCGTVAAASGVAVPPGEQELGNCLLTVGDGAGSSLDQNDDTDVPADTECTTYECLSGVLQPTQLDLGVECSEGLCDGEGLCAECVVASDCVELPPSDECGRRACNDHQCERVFTANGTAIEAQSDGDCKLRVCDGQGGQRDEAAPTDLPDDGNECTQNLCNGLDPSHPYEDENTVCPAGYCNSTGQCVGCTHPEQCGEDTECLTWSCTGQNVCEIHYVVEGTAVSTGQSDGDCQLIVCDGNGGQMTQDDPTDPPPDDGHECTGETCVSGSPQHPDEQTPWDCQLNVCDGLGGTTSIAQDTEDPCTDDECNAGVPSNPPTASGVSCGEGTVCDGQGNCVPCVADGHCLASQYCSNNTCEPDLPQGSHCSRAAMCSTGYCVDGYCCGGSCHRVCEACAGSKTGDLDGTCAAVTAMTDPDEECTDEALCLDVMICCNPDALHGHQGYPCVFPASKAP